MSLKGDEGRKCNGPCQCGRCYGWGIGLLSGGGGLDGVVE